MEIMVNCWTHVKEKRKKKNYPKKKANETSGAKKKEKEKGIIKATLSFTFIPLMPYTTTCLNPICSLILV